MRRIVAVALALVGIWCLGQQPLRSQDLGFGVWKSASHPNNTALDGAVTTGASTAPATLPNLTTSAAGIVIACVAINATFTGITVVGSSLGTFTQRANSDPSLANNPILSFYAVSAGALTNESIVVTVPMGIGNFTEATAFGVKGVKTGTNHGFDANGILPVAQTLPSASPVVVSTSNANDFLFVCSRGGGYAGPPTGGWAAIPVAGGAFTMTAYLKVTSTQPSLSVADPDTSNGMIGDALVSN